MTESQLHDPAHLRRAGALIIAAAYALRGWRVSWPLEPAPYDLLVEPPDGGGLLRVQVKTCTTKQHDNWICWIRRSTYVSVPGGKRRVGYDAGDVDVLGVVDGDLNAYLIPFSEVSGQTAVTLRAHEGRRIASVKLAGPVLMGTSRGE